MQPETGDPAVRVDRDDVATALLEGGGMPGDTIFFHSSLSSMGTVLGGADTVVDGFLDAVGAEGTVAVPTLCNWRPEEQSLVFGRWDPNTTPSYVGCVTEALRRRRQAMRSDHATHSVAAIGGRARELTANHGSFGPRPGPFGGKAFALASPWQRLYDWDAAYCFVGVTFRVNTMVHFVESLVVQRALARAPLERRPELEQKVVGWMKPGVWPQIRIEDREVFEAMLAEKGLVRYGKIGSATLRCARARSMVDHWVAVIESDPARWLPATFTGWLAEAGES